VLKGWQLNNVTTIQSGQPFTIRLGFNRSGNLNTTSFSMNERPNWNPSFGGDPVLNSPDGYLDVSAFAMPAANTRGTMPRNALTGPGLVNSDLALVKGFSLAPNRTLQVRIEAFNLFDRANFAVPSGRILYTNAAGDVSPTFGRITATTTTSRQIQVGLKYLF